MKFFVAERHRSHLSTSVQHVFPESESGKSPISVIFLRKDCPLNLLNQFFPAGIPISGAGSATGSPTPTLDLDGWECFEAPLSSFSITKQADIMQALFSEGVPDRIGRACYCYATLAIPAQWVEVAA